jgi:tetratricopeptide (TPR) repeat protein
MPSGPEVARFLANLGAVYRQIGKASQARAAFGRALSISEACLGANHLSVAWNLDQIGDLEAHEGNLPAAIFAFCRALAIKERTAGPDSWEAGVTLNKLCDVYFKQGRYNDAESFLLRVLGIRERAFGWQDPALAKPLTWLGRIYARQRKDGRAEHLVRYALKLFLDVLPSSHPDIIDCLRLLSEVYRGLGRYKDADAVWTLAQGLVDGTASSEKIGRYVFAEPPRICESSALVFGVTEVPS